MTRNLVVAAVVSALLLSSSAVVFAQTSAPPVSSDLSGMFTFLREGEIVQLTVQDGELSGFVSRFGDSDTDKGEFIDQFFDKASIQGEHLTREPTTPASAP